MVYWGLLREEVRRLESGTPRPLAPKPSQTAPYIYALHKDRLEPDAPDESSLEPPLFVATPEDVNALRSADPEKALAWRLAQREAFSELFARGYKVTRFVDGHYLLTR